MCWALFQVLSIITSSHPHEVILSSSHIKDDDTVAQNVLSAGK